ncbi:hypothetical protein BDM02DRAFT_1255730 [Thelephora ganbajun]|uniref:Uncharacterized protein n=1 Tax=Thelephora ganbajun TaxID=370292 RepID=A0ACB6ZLW6_THEGA|nr:hypothetical protein BDM02DRAFT_1255730 [Thelephora ganbajun]
MCTNRGRGWDFCIPIRARGTGTNLYRYTPKSDFSVFYTLNGCPCLIGEIVSVKSEEDRRRMKLQGIAVARAGKLLLTKDAKDEFVLMAIYVSADLVATRYLFQARGNNYVDSHEKRYKLTEVDGATELLRELFNWRAYAIGFASKFSQDKTKGSKEFVKTSNSCSPPSVIRYEKYFLDHVWVATAVIPIRPHRVVAIFESGSHPTSKYRSVKPRTGGSFHHPCIRVHSHDYKSVDHTQTPSYR